MVPILIFYGNKNYFQNQYNISIVIQIERSRRMENADIVQLLITQRQHIEKTVRKTVKNPSLADDIVQEVCIKIYKYIKNHGVPSNFVAWLTTVCKNTSTDHLRKLKRNKELLDQLQQEATNPLSSNTFLNPEEEFITKQNIQAVKKMLETLDEETKTILILRQQGLSYNEISEKLAIPLSTVKTKVFRGRKRLISQFKGGLLNEMP
jgi:RNA polymerase sigma-70 factor, ECF subfamily